MQLDLTYGDTSQRVSIPDRNLLGILQPSDVEPTQNTMAELDKTAEAAAQFLEGSHRILVLVNDYTRPTPNSLILTRLEPAIKDKDVRFVICLGTHRVPTDSEFRTILGSGFYERHKDRITCHDSRDKSGLFFQGKTSFGTGVWFSRQLLRPDRIIAVNSVEPHYFAGFTGGRKTFLPGIAGHDTICHNHNMAIRPGSTTFSLKGNPVHEDMAEAARMVTCPVFSIQVVLDRNKRPYSLYHGDLVESFAAAARDCRSVYAVPVKKKADIVLSVLRPPYDINFYQSQRAVEFARPALGSPGVQITVSACRNGVGNDDFIRVFGGCSKPSQVLEYAEGKRRLGWHKSARLAQIMETADLYTVMGVDDTAVRQAFMHPFQSIQEALDAAIENIGPDARVYVIPDAGAVVPVVET